MGFLSKIFGNKEEESFKLIEEELDKLKKKTESEMIALIGSGGRLKGLPLIYVCDDEMELKKFSARLNELVKPIELLSDKRSFRDLIISYENSVLFYKPILSNVSYFAIFQNRDNMLPLKQWVYKKEDALKELFHE